MSAKSKQERAELNRLAREEHEFREALRKRKRDLRRRGRKPPKVVR